MLGSVADLCFPMGVHAGWGQNSISFPKLLRALPSPYNLWKGYIKKKYHDLRHQYGWPEIMLLQRTREHRWARQIDEL
jgi:hypothetical protein